MKNAQRIFAAILVIAFAFSLFAGCSKSGKDKEFSRDGFKITLNDGFEEQTVENQTAAYSSDKYIVTALKEGFELFENAGYSTDISEEEYAKMVMENNSLDGSTEIIDGIVTFSYEMEVEGQQMSYLATVKKGSDAFWLIQFVSLKTVFESSRNQFMEWAKTVTVE